ncbi:MAG TPA: DUF2783 domain-containing protein [Stellaceae bacterium]|nr:DUF2783 domain-containing protein [Stellaceae bacterium]
MTELRDTANFEDGDAFYAALVEAIDRQDDDGAVALLARLVLILANQIGDRAVLHAALDLAVTSEPRRPVATNPETTPSVRRS